MPNYKEIRNMSDKELNSFLAEIQRSDKRICQKCGEFILNKRTLSVRKNYNTRTLCTLCESCYSDLLDFLAISDVNWEE